jgi:hypothetical protein
MNNLILDSSPASDSGQTIGKKVQRNWRHHWKCDGIRHGSCGHHSWYPHADLVNSNFSGRSQQLGSPPSPPPPLLTLRIQTGESGTPSKNFWTGIYPVSWGTPGVPHKKNVQKKKKNEKMTKGTRLPWITWFWTVPLHQTVVNVGACYAAWRITERHLPKPWTTRRTASRSMLLRLATAALESDYVSNVVHCPWQPSLWRANLRVGVGYIRRCRLTWKFSSWLALS